MPTADIHTTGNYLEAVLWIIVDLVFAVYAFRETGTVRKCCWLAA